MTVGRMHQEDAPALPSAHRPGIPAQLNALVRILLAKDPADRPKNAHAAENAIAEISRVLNATDDTIERANESDTPVSSASLSQHIEALDLRIFELEILHDRRDQLLIDARTEHAELTGQSGDTRSSSAPTTSEHWTPSKASPGGMAQRAQTEQSPRLRSRRLGH
jgi:serine/threonine-protein kinase